MASGVRRAVLAALPAAALPGLAAPTHAAGNVAGNPTANLFAMDCDRACLTAVLEDGLRAITAKDISTLPLGNDVPSTSNGVAIRLDDGLWRTVDAEETMAPALPMDRVKTRFKVPPNPATVRT